MAPANGRGSAQPRTAFGTARTAFGTAIGTALGTRPRSPQRCADRHTAATCA